MGEDRDRDPDGGGGYPAALCKTIHVKYTLRVGAVGRGAMLRPWDEWFNLSEQL